MLMRTRDLVSALMMFPLAISSLLLGVMITLAMSGMATETQDVPPTMAQPSDSGYLVTAIIVLMHLVVPIIYFAVIYLHVRSNPSYRYFGSLSPKTFVAFSVAVFLLPMIGGVMIVLAFG